MKEKPTIPKEREHLLLSLIPFSGLVEKIKPTLHPERAQKLQSAVYTSGKEILFIYHRQFQIQSTWPHCQLRNSSSFL